MDASHATIQMVLLLALLMGLSILAFVAVMRIRKMVFSQDTNASSGGFTLHDLRQLRDAGTLTEQEFEVARDKVVAAAKKAAENQANAAAKSDKQRKLVTSRQA